MAEKKGFKECPFCNREVEEGLLRCPYCNRFYRLTAVNEKNNKSTEEKSSGTLKTRFRLKAVVLFLFFLLIISLLFYFFSEQEETPLPKKNLLPQKLKSMIQSPQAIKEIRDGEVKKEGDSTNENGKENPEKVIEPITEPQKQEKNSVSETKVTETSKTEAFTHYKNGINFKKEGKWGLAGEEFSKSISLDPANAWAHHGLGRVYLQKGMDNEALKEFGEVIRINPKIAIANYYRGKIYQNKNDMENAIREFKKTIGIDSNFLWAHYRLGEIYKKKGEKDLAKKEFEIYENLKKANDRRIEN
ncbi:MAG: hypothetical protein A2149_02170 [Candidatus Schekmanbacteria bacterium RBG_16_38_11]|uniref:Uncharacterized protein n=1 Tax=Candidatus Schekmanbacteria bacterium RBG_16_38_11 TaxID=1817880 RepID=A0A1F7RWJ0_9BACT|nr:MAG: hypothetical protein A2149_02170 [Candidatus Schekmanbacteria bacterium RBG_16_38_11]